MDKLSETLHHIYERGSSSLSNPFLKWLGDRFIKPCGLSYQYFDFDPIASFEEEGIYPVLVGPKIIEVNLPSNLPKEVLTHQKLILEATSERSMLLDIQLDHNLVPKIKSRRSLDERNAQDRPMIELVEQVKSSDAYFTFLKASLGICKMASDDLLRYLAENRRNTSLQEAVLRNDYDQLIAQVTQNGSQTELVL